MNAAQSPDSHRLHADVGSPQEVVSLQTCAVDPGRSLSPGFAGPQNAQAQHAQTALENFSALLYGMDFNLELNMLGLKRLLFWRRQRFRNEFRALTIGLWRLALARSFPAHWQRIFDVFLQHWLDGMDNPEKARAFEEKVHNYIVLLDKKRESDFTEVGARLVDLLKLPEKNAVSLRLRLALHIRSLYTLVFDRLI